MCNALTFRVPRIALLASPSHLHLAASLFLVVALLAALVFFPSAVAARVAGRNGGVSGYVRDAGSQDPVVSARVELMSENGLAAPASFTDENGEFHFGYLRDGDYRIIVTKMGYQRTEISISVVAGHTTPIEIDLKRANSDSEPSTNEETKRPETISAHELSAPRKARDDYSKGQELMDKKDYDGAIAAFQKAVREFPDFYEAYARMGVAQYMTGHAADARASLQKSIDLSNGKYADALFDLADVYNDVGNYAAAEPLAKRVITLDGTSWHGYFELARSLLGLKRYPEAERNGRKCVELAPDNQRARVILTNIHIGMHDYPAAVDDIDAYLKLDSVSPTSDTLRSTRAQLARAIADAQKKSGAPPKTEKPVVQPQ